MILLCSKFRVPGELNELATLKPAMLENGRTMPFVWNVALSLSPTALSSQTGGSRNGSWILGSLKLIDSHYNQFFLSFFFSLTPTHISELSFHTTPSRKPSCLPNLSWLCPQCSELPCSWRFLWSFEVAGLYFFAELPVMGK